MAGTVFHVFDYGNLAADFGALGAEYANYQHPKKKGRPTEREVNTPLFLLRCLELGLSISDLDLLTVGMVLDMLTEQKNDEYKYPKLATQADFDRW